MQKFGEVKFSKDMVKIQIWGKPVIFSHELCLYITRFAGQPSLVPRPSPVPVFDRFQYAKTEPEGLVNLTT